MSKNYSHPNAHIDVLALEITDMYFQSRSIQAKTRWYHGLRAGNWKRGRFDRNTQIHAKNQICWFRLMNVTYISIFFRTFTEAQYIDHAVNKILSFSICLGKFIQLFGTHTKW